MSKPCTKHPQINPRIPGDGHPRCRQCRYDAHKRWYEKNKYRADVLAKTRAFAMKHSFANRERYLKKNYNLTVDDYNRMLADQNGLCIICNKDRPSKRLDKRTYLVVDHNHKTGQVRKLLCYNCNSLVGLCDEDPQILRRAIEYIEAHNE